jgi:DNA polymerase-3 subunit beta
MKITLSAKSLLHALQRCQSIVERRHTVPILANVLLHADENFLQITATDLQVGIRNRIPTNVQVPGAITVAAHKLFEIVKELDSGADVSLELRDNFVVIRSGRSRFSIASISAEEYPGLSEEENAASLNMDAAKLSDMIAATSFAMSNDETRKYLTGTLFEVGDEQAFRLVATDGHRLALSEIQLNQAAEQSQCIVPRKAVTEIRKLCDECDGEVELFLGERQIRLVADGNVLISKLIDARFPVYQDVIPVGNPSIAIIERSGVDQILRRSMIVANEFTHDVCLNFSERGLDISAHNTEQEEAEEHISAEYSDKEVAIGFNGRYLRDALGAMHSEAVRMEIKDEFSPVLLTASDNSQARYVIMPLRI